MEDSKHTARARQAADEVSFMRRTMRQITRGCASWWTMHTRITRERLVEDLGAALRGDDRVRAAWLGGSEATGRTDRFSDLDVVCLAEDDAVEAVFDLARAALERLSPIDLQWRVPSPTWHGHEQVFMRLRDVDPHLMIDLVVMKRSAPASTRFMESERHGRPRVLLDRDGVAIPEPMDRPAHQARLRARLERLRLTFPLFQPLVSRAVERRHPCDAACFYNQLTLLPTVEVLRMVHCPDRFDFGMRYLFDDLPPEVYRRICALALPGGLDAIAACRAEAETHFNAAVALLDARYPRPFPA
jgi:hypothetical protein